MATKENIAMTIWDEYGVECVYNRKNKKWFLDGDEVSGSQAAKEKAKSMYAESKRRDLLG